MKKYLLFLFLLPAIAKSQNVGVNTSLPMERLHVNGSLLITPYNTTNDTIKNSSINLGFNSYSIFAYNAAKAALRFGLPNPDSKWFNNNVGNYSFAFGVGADASGAGSLAYGFNTKAAGGNSTALGGYGSIASGYAAVAGGNNSIASGQSSFAFGETLITRNDNSAVFGSYNDTTQNANTLFSIGDGIANNSRKNALSVLKNGYTGIGQSNPGYALDVFDAANQGFFANFTSNNANNSFLQIQANASGTNIANIGMGMYRNGAAKGYFYVNGSNNFIWSTNVAEQVALTPAGNLGIGQNNPGFPLNFASSLGDKIALYGNSGSTYGFGIATNLLQIHSDISGSDIAFGYGSSGSFTERMRVKGNGFVGIGTSNPAARLQLQQQGLYSRSEGQGNALEIWDTTGTGDGILYMGADNTNFYGYIQSVATGSFRDLLLEGRGGNVIVGKDAGSSLQVKGDAVVDYAGTNTGTVSSGLRFGTGSSGEGIASKRSAGGNQNGLDIYTAGSSRVSISNAGQVTIPGNLVLTGFQPTVSDIAGVRQKIYSGDANLVANNDPAGYDGTGVYAINPGIFTSKPIAWIGSFTTISGTPNKVLLSTEVVPNGSTWNVIIHINNVSGAPVSYNATWKVVIMGTY